MISLSTLADKNDFVKKTMKSSFLLTAKSRANNEITRAKTENLGDTSKLYIFKAKPLTTKL
jgi:hypothetical protein